MHSCVYGASLQCPRVAQTPDRCAQEKLKGLSSGTGLEAARVSKLLLSLAPVCVGGFNQMQKTLIRFPERKLQLRQK